MNIANDPRTNILIDVVNLRSFVNKISRANNKYADAAMHAGTKINLALLISIVLP